mmetsp:Transcript_15105/g.49540  ORF Transcript_15105/g.49540 Transcript_15105/m.49540 type:complete len:231 (-) Transcript_15105:1317-2009(-)
MEVIMIPVLATLRLVRVHMLVIMRTMPVPVPVPIEPPHAFRHLASHAVRRPVHVRVPAEWHVRVVLAAPVRVERVRGVRAMEHILPMLVLVVVAFLVVVPTSMDVRMPLLAKELGVRGLAVVMVMLLVLLCELHEFLLHGFALLRELRLHLFELLHVLANGVNVLLELGVELLGLLNLVEQLFLHEVVELHVLLVAVHVQAGTLLLPVRLQVFELLHAALGGFERVQLLL